MTQVTRFGWTQAMLTYRLGYDPADLLQQVDSDYNPDLAADVATVIEVARQVDVISPVSDLALGITPTAFGASPTWTNVGNLTDGSGSTFASGPNYVESGTVNKGFSIDLGAPAAVSEHQLTVTPYSPYPYNIESSPDNSTWTDRPYTRTGPVSSVYTYTLTGGPITARYWRFRRSYHGYIGPQRVYTWKIAGSTSTSSTKTWFGTGEVNDFDDATYEPSDGVGDSLRALFPIDQKLARVRLLVGSEISGSVTYELQHATALDFSDATTDATVTLTSAGGYAGDEVIFSWEPFEAYSLWQVVSSADENRRFYTFEAYENPVALSDYQLRSEKDQPNGYAGLDSSGLIDPAELPPIALDDLSDVATAGAADNDVLTYDSGSGTWGPAAGTSGSALTVKDEGTPLDTAVTSIDFVGSAVVATNVGHAVTVTITAGSSLEAKDEGSSLDTAVTSLNFVGGTITATHVGHAVTVTTPDFGGTGDMSAEALGSTVSAGSSGKLADAGHRHAMFTGATPSGGYGTAAAGASASVLRADAVLPKPTAADVDFSADVTTSNATTGHHGLLPKLDGSAAHFLDGTGAWTAPPGVTLENAALLYLAHQVK